MGLFSCFTGRQQPPQRRSRRSRRSKGASGATNGLTIRTSIGSSELPLSIYGSPRSALSEEDDYFDAFEHHVASSSGSSRGGGDLHNTGGSFSDAGGGDFDSTASDEGIVDRLAAWWHSRAASAPAGSKGGADGPTTSSGGSGEHRTPTAAGSLNGRESMDRPNSHPHHRSHGHKPHAHHSAASPRTSIPPGAAILEPEMPSGCINLFTAAQSVLAARKLLRLAKPRAGMSFKELTPEAKAAEAGCAWEEADPSTFLVRSQSYMKSKQKEAAGEGLYRLLGVDMYSFDFKLYHIAEHIELPPAPKLGPAAEALPPGKRLPPLLVINLQLPTYPPSVFGGTDGAGHSLVYYFALPEGWEPSHVANQAALGMVQRFFGNGVESDGQPTRDRLKLLPRIVNVDEWAVKGPLSGAEVRLLRSYNGKPLLTRPQQRFYTHPNGHYVEVDLDVHSYAYIARRAFHGYLSRLAAVIFENAFVLQGNRAEDLPEIVMAAARVHRVDFTKSTPFPAQSLEELGHGEDEDGPPASQ